MAKIFSWALKNVDNEITGYAYLSKEQGKEWGEGYTIKKPDAKIDEPKVLKEIANVVSQYSQETYTKYFDEMVKEAKEYGVSRSLFKDASFYYNVGGSIIMLSGADGVSNNAGLTCAIFRNEDKGKTLTVDDTPTFGNVYYDKTSKKLKGLEKGWTDNAESRSSNQVTWMSSAYFRDTENGEQITNWCTPILITGEDGRDGSDGKNSEFIYALTKDDKEQPKYPTTDAGREALFNALAESSEPRDVDGTKWWDRAQAIDPENYLAEWVWTRFKKAGSDEWIYTERPVIWALWGSDGTDGDGIEYIFQRTHTIDEHPTPLPKPLKDYFDIQTWKEEYNKDEYIPDDWSDNPMGVDKDYQCEWVSTRKYTKQEKGKYDFYDYIENKDKMAWGEFSDPVIWSNHSKKGISTYTSFIFTRTNDTKITTYHVHGGTYDDPLEGIETREADDVTIVSGIKWDDTVPGGSAPVYMCRRVFSDEDTGEKNEWWSQPVLMADNPNFQVEYSADYNPQIAPKENFLPSLNEFKDNSAEGIDEAAWRARCLEDGYGTWGDDDSIVSPIYMATSRRRNNVWTDWVISKIKGEKGEKGESIQLKGSVVIEEDVATSGTDPTFVTDTKHYNVNDLGCAFYDDDSDPKFYDYVQMWIFTQKKWEKLKGEVGDCYYTPTHGHLVKWNDEKNGWEDAGLFKGEPGESGTTYYLHTAYANEDPNGTYVILNDGTGIRLTRLKEGAGKYFGVYTDTILDDEEDLSKKWQWARWNGEDGYGMEQIFRLGTAENVPFVPTEETPYDEEPLGWLDSPIEPTRDQIICYTCHRRYGKSKQWKGTEDGHALVYNRYVENGLSAAVLSISNDSLSTLIDEENKTLITDTEESPIHFVYGTTEIDINPDKVTVSGIAAEHWEAYYSPEKKAVITQIKPGKAFIEIKDGQEIAYNNIQVNVEATITDGGVDRIIRGEAHIMIRGIQSDHLYEISTDRDTIHKDSYGSLIVGQKEIYLFLNKQYNNSGVGKIIPITQVSKERDWRIYYAIDNSERQEIKNFTPTEYIKGVSTAITVFSTDIQEKPNNSIQLITEMVTDDGKHIITDTETIKVVNNGKDGQDASEIEYVYHIYPTGTRVTIEENLSQEHGRIHDPDNPGGFIETDDHKRNDDWMPSDKHGSYWTDRPVSIGVGQEEWCAIRYKKGGDEGWGNFEAPFIWSAYGITGRDGDGVEYVYYINNGETPILNQNVGYYWNGSQFILVDRQHEDFLPAAEDPVTPNKLHWTDEPGSVTKDNPVQWVAKRKFHDATPEGGTKGWDYFSEPTVWNNYSETGVNVDFTNDKALIGTDQDTILDKETTTETDIFMRYGLDYCNNLAITSLTYNGASTTIPTIDGTYTQIGTTGKVELKLSRKTVGGAEYIHFDFKLGAGLDLTEPIYIGVNLSGKNQQGLSVAGTNMFAIAGLKGGDEAVQYNIIVNPHGASVNSAGIFNVSKLTITVNKTEGKNPPTPLTGLTSTQKLYYTVGNSTSETLLTYGKTGATLNITAITESTVNFKFKVDNILVDEEAIHIVRDGQGSLTADLDNENILIGTGSDTILGKDSTGHTTTLILRDGTGYCTELGLIGTHVSGKYSFDNVNIPKGTPRPIGKKDDGKDIEISMGYAQSDNTGLTFTMNLYSGLELADPYVFTFIVTGKTQSGISVQGSTTLTLGGLKGGKEALHYHLITTPSGINISKDGSWSSENIKVMVQRIDGDVVTEVTRGKVAWGVNNLGLTQELELTDGVATLTKSDIMRVPTTPKTVTFSFTENGFVETETLYIVTDGERGDDSVVYQIVCDPDTVNVTTGGTYSPATIKVDLLRISGSTTTVLTSLPSGATLKYHTDTHTTETSISPGKTWTLSDLTGISDANVLTFNFVYGNYKTTTSIRITRNTKGSDGYPGCIYRRSVWAPGKKYHNDSDEVPQGNTPRYIDAVFNEDCVVGTDVSKLRCWVCKQTHDSDETNDPKTGSEESAEVWDVLPVEEPFYSPLILAKQISADMIDVTSLAADEAFIKNLQVDTLKTNNSSGKTGYSYIRDNRIESFTKDNDTYLSIHDGDLSDMRAGSSYSINKTNIQLYNGTNLMEEKYNINLNPLTDDKFFYYDVYYDGKIIDTMNATAQTAVTINITQKQNTVFIPGLEIECSSYNVFSREIDSTWGIIIPIFLRKKNSPQTRKLITYRTIGAGINVGTPGSYIFERYQPGYPTQIISIGDYTISNIETGEWELCVGWGFYFYSRKEITHQGTGKYLYALSIKLTTWNGTVKVNYSAKGVEIGGGAFRVAETTDGYFQTTGDVHEFKSGQYGLKITNTGMSATLSGGTIPMVPIVFAGKLTSTNGNLTTTVIFSSIGRSLTTSKEKLGNSGYIAVIDGPGFQTDDIVIATIDNVITEDARDSLIPCTVTARPSANKLKVAFWDGYAAYPGFTSSGTYSCYFIVIRD